VHSIMMDRNWQVSGRSGSGAAVGDPQTSHAYASGESSTTAVESTGTSAPRPYRPFAGPPIVIGQMTSVRRTSGMENKL